MKKAILTLAAIASVAAANAQREGQVFVYGGVGFNYEKPSTTFSFSGGNGTFEVKNQSAFVTPGIGYQFNEHWGIGLNFNYTLTKSDSSASFTGTATDFSNTRSSEILVGPFVRYTQHLGEHFFVYGQFNAGYIHGNEHDENNLSGATLSNDEGYNGFAFNIVPAIGINLSRCWAVTGSFGDIGYRHINYDAPNGLPAGVTSDTKNDKFGINFGQQFTLGVQWNFGGAMDMHKGHHGMMDDTRNTDTSDDDMDNGKKKKKVRRDDDE